MRIGIIGLPQSGKTTIFNAAAGRHEAVGDYSKASHRAVIKVPDDRLNRLALLVNPRKTTHAEIEYIDVTAFSGRGKESDKTALDIPEDLKRAEALMVVLDCFSPECRPERDFNLFTDEMILADQVIIERNLDKRERTAKLTGDQEALNEVEIFRRCLTSLENGQPLSMIDLDDQANLFLRNYTLLSIKPLLGVLNIGEADLGQESKYLERFASLVMPERREFVAICGKIEMEIAALGPQDRKLFLDELGIGRPAMELLIQKSYDLLGLISFFTVGEPDARAWTIHAGTNARKAAGAVHTDMERGFIRAEVVTTEDYLTCGSLHAAKEAGKYRLEGKEYTVADGDVILFRFNV